MSEAPRYATLQDYVRVLRQQRLLIVLVTLVFGAAAFGISARQSPIYAAEAAVSFSDPTQDLDIFGTPVLPRQAPGDRAATEADQVSTIPRMEAARLRLHTSLPAPTLLSKVSSRVEIKTNYVVVQARDGNAAFAARLANAVAREAAIATNTRERARIQALIATEQRRLRKLGSGTSEIVASSNTADRIARLQGLLAFSRPAEIARTAQAPTVPVSPRPVRNTILGLLLGLTLGIVAAFVRDSLDRRLRGSREIQEHLKLPLLGHVSSHAMGRGGLVSNGREALGDEDFEAVRILRTNMEFLSLDKSLRSILVTSALPEEGKSTVATSLAFASALAGKRTLLVECDLRRPALAGRLGLKTKPGLSDYLLSAADSQEILQTLPVETLAPPKNGAAANGDTGNYEPPARLVCITAGQMSPRPAETLGSERFKQFLSQVSDAYDLVILDSSPLLPVVDTLELLPHVDGVLICVRASQTTRDQAHAAKAALDHFPPRPTGLVVTGVRPDEETDYGYYYSYAYGPT